MSEVEEPLDASASDVPATRAPAAPDNSAITEVEQYLLDDVPLFHLPMAGSTILTIAFRVGRADEPVPRGGMTHLAEHLILTAVSDALDHSNGSTEPFRVTFTLRGSPNQASQFLRDVCKSIETPRLSRMHEEANVLRTEAAGRGAMGLGMRLIWYRTGYQGIGTCHLPELFLRQLDEKVLKAWIAEHLVAGNAAIWIAGDIPDDLLVTLPPGPRKAMPEMKWVPQFETPTIVQDDIPGVGASFYVERSVAAATAMRTLDRHLKRALRVDRGLGYDVGSDYMPVSSDHALATVWATCLPNAVADVERVLLETIDDIAARGPSEEELAQQYERFAREAVDPMAVPGRLDAHVTRVLLGAEPEPLADILDEQWRLQPEQVAAAFRVARDTMLFLVPANGTLPQRPFRPYPGPMEASMGNGRRFELIPEKRKLRWGKAKSLKMTVSDIGVAVDDPRGNRIIGIRWADCVAVVCEPNFRSLVSRDGTTFPIDAVDWRDGRSAIGMIDRLAPRDLVVPFTS